MLRLFFLLSLRSKPPTSLPAQPFLCALGKPLGAVVGLVAFTSLR